MKQDQLIQRLKDMSDIDKAGMMNTIARRIGDIYIRRFRTEEARTEKMETFHTCREKWRKRHFEQSKKQLGTSIRTRSGQHRACSWYEYCYAATHQFGDEGVRSGAKRGQEPEVPDWRQMDQQATGKCEDTGEEISGYQ